MNPTQISAQFAAYTWFLHGNAGLPVTEEEASAFARDNWEAFLHCAHNGLGQLLIRLADPRRQQLTRLARITRQSKRGPAPRRILAGTAG
jgi:hypothetical protein